MMDDDPESTQPEVAESSNNKRSASTRSQPSPTPEASKRRRENTPPQAPPPANGFTPTNRRMGPHSGLSYEEPGKTFKIYAEEMELQIIAEARGVSRKNVPMEEFRSIYLHGFRNAEALPGLTIDSVQEIGKENQSWSEIEFFRRLHTVLSDEVLGDLRLTTASSKSFRDSINGKEVASKPDFVLVPQRVSSEGSLWANVEFLIEHSSTKHTDAVTEKFRQWLRCAWSVFHHQPFRRHLYGIMFLKPCAYICYVDHGCAVYSEHLEFADNNQHTQYLIDFLSCFISESENRGKDPTVGEEIANDTKQVWIQHAGKRWIETPKDVLWYRPCLIGRHIRVARVDPVSENPNGPMVMKSVWEEKIPEDSSPPREAKILRILLEANVRGLPQPYHLDDVDNLEIETRRLAQGGGIALLASDVIIDKMKDSSYASNHTSKQSASARSTGAASARSTGAASAESTGDEFVGRRAKMIREDFNRPLETQRRLTRIVMSYCQPLKEAMRNGTPELLMRTIRDSMIVYYEAYKRPKSGFIHGDISLENIMVPIEGSELTGGLSFKDRCGTIVDWNLCFTADGTTSSRTYRSGTPAFMAPVLLDVVQIDRRTLGHDMESFFAVIVWIASFEYDNRDKFRVKPIGRLLLNPKNTSENIANTKLRWFNTAYEFKTQILQHFQSIYRRNKVFLKCLANLRRVLYSVAVDENDELPDDELNNNNSMATEDTDPMKEGLFRECMKEIDSFVGDNKGCTEMELIDSFVGDNKGCTEMELIMG